MVSCFSMSLKVCYTVQLFPWYIECFLSHPRELCIIPLRKKGIHWAAKEPPHNTHTPQTHLFFVLLNVVLHFSTVIRFIVLSVVIWLITIWSCYLPKCPNFIFSFRSTFWQQEMKGKVFKLLYAQRFRGQLQVLQGLCRYNAPISAPPQETGLFV